MNATTSSDVQGARIVTVVPDELKKLTLYLAKVFYGKEHSVIVDYIQRKVYVKEDTMREDLRLDGKELKAIIKQMRNDKMIRERHDQDEIKKTKDIYYFLNYKAIINVSQYKIDHMRQKLDAADKNESRNTHYRCTNTHCLKKFEAIDIHLIYDRESDDGEMRCWQCSSTVEEDKSVGSSALSRNALAQFNMQMAGINSMLQAFNGIRFSNEILEPTIRLDAADARERTGPSRINALGGKMRTELYGGSGINLVLGEEMSQTSEKTAVPWLQDNREQQASASAFGISSATTMNGHTPHQILLHEDEKPAKIPRLSQEVSVKKEEQQSGSESASESSDEEDFVQVQGKRVPIHEVNKEMSKCMSAEELDAYRAAIAEKFQSDF